MGIQLRWAQPGAKLRPPELKCLLQVPWATRRMFPSELFSCGPTGAKLSVHYGVDFFQKTVVPFSK